MLVTIPNQVRLEKKIILKVPADVQSFQSSQRRTLTVWNVTVTDAALLRHQTVHVADSHSAESARIRQAEIRDDRRRQLVLQLHIVVSAVQEDFYRMVS